MTGQTRQLAKSAGVSTKTDPAGQERQDREHDMNNQELIAEARRIADMLPGRPSTVTGSPRRC